MFGRARRPRCFGRMDAEEFSIYYEVRGNGWMNSAKFHRWLLRVDTYVYRTPGRRVLLFIDNASVHGSIDNIPQLHNVCIEFLPERTTSILQPLDFGVIACIKKHYKQKFSQKAMDLIDERHIQELYSIDLKLAGL